MPRTRPARRRIAAIAALAVFAVPFAGGNAGADPHEVCAGGSPGTHVTSAFCVSYTAAIGPTLNARDPFDADITFANTSDNHQTEQTRWIDTVTVHLAASDTTAPSIIPSKALPNGLVIAGDDDDCTPPSFANCDAGHGVFVVNISGTPIPVVNGDHTGTFGIKRVVNVNDADTDPGTIRYRFDLEVCAAVFGSCDLDKSYSEEVEAPIPPPTAGGAVDATLQVFQEGDETVSGQTAHYKGTLDSGEIHLEGTATKLAGSTGTVGPYKVFRFPARCGTVGGSGEFTSHKNPNPDTVEIAQQSAAIGGCPTAAFTRSIHGSNVSFNGGGSAAHVAGRTVKSWRWAFGDGAHLSRTVATAVHGYPLSPATPTDYTAQLIVVDSEGAISLPATSVVHGTATSVGAVIKAPASLRVSGSLAPFLGNRDVTVLLQRRQSGAFHTVSTKHVTTNGASEFTTVFTPRPPAGMCRAVARFVGDATHLASSVTKTFSC